MLIKADCVSMTSRESDYLNRLRITLHEISKEFCKHSETLSLPSDRAKNLLMKALLEYDRNKLLAARETLATVLIALNNYGSLMEPKLLKKYQRKISNARKWLWKKLDGCDMPTA